MEPSVKTDGNRCGKEEIIFFHETTHPLSNVVRLRRSNGKNISVSYLLLASYINGFGLIYPTSP